MGIETTFNQGLVDSFHIHSENDIAPGNRVVLDIIKFSLHPGCGFSSKLIPLVVRLLESGPGNVHSTDIFTFDGRGNLLVHGMSYFRDDEPVVNEAHDLDTRRLSQMGGYIAEMLSDKYLTADVPHWLTSHPTYAGLKDNDLDDGSLVL